MPSPQRPSNETAELVLRAPFGEAVTCRRAIDDDCASEPVALV
ncbi:MAG TPA: hypothetical protein VEC57_17025 [Candidatus Limnocylindrales bacterium]|nr:hypothetical protein [Candidatus Limnocylindrales bacterium]